MKKSITLIFSLFSISVLSFFANAELNLELPQQKISSVPGQSGHYISAIKERDQGIKILRSLRSKGFLVENPEVNLWIRSLGNKLTTHAPSTLTPFYFVVSKDLSVNAFATLGGVIVINAGLILRTESESELAAVISHEIAHVTQRHIQRILAKAENSKFAQGATLVAGAIVASQNSQAGAAIFNAGIAASVHQQLAFGRDAESEADRVGLRILASAGFNPNSMPTFLQKLERFGNTNTAEIREFLQNHPLSVKRVADTSLRAKKYGPYKGRENISYLYMREKIRYLMNDISPVSQNLPDHIKNYANAIKLKKHGNVAVKDQLNKLQKSNNISVAILTAELHNKQKQHQKVLQVLNPLIRIYPGNEAISAPLAQAYLSLGQLPQAWRVLQDINLSEQTSLEIFEIKQNVARLMGNTSLAYRAVAQRSIRTGHYKSAKTQIAQAIKLPGSNVLERQEMQEILNRLNRNKKGKR